MCGITGCLSFSTSHFRVTRSFIDLMRDVMSHRGPDGADTWVSPSGRVGLGHRRLSIIDLSTAASQPMCNEDGSLWVTFNGEIYNHTEIRKELEDLGGHTWKTHHSDTEVILHAFEQWGIDCVHKFRGMFAIGIWDEREQQLWLIRDRIGIKPLYYSIHHSRITFASEIKALLRDPDQQRAVNEESFYHYLSFLATPGPDTMFAGIQKLAGGTWLRVTADGDVVQQRYWDVWDHTNPLTGVSEDEIAEMLLAELRTSVNLRKVSDVPVGVFLSGGIDSSTNAALFSEGEVRPVNTFSIGYDCDYQTYKSELPFARRMAQEVGAEHFERILSQRDFIEFLPEMIRLEDEPIADPVCFPLYFVSKLAREHGVIVCQVGEGADELFWGYVNWKVRLRLEEYNQKFRLKWPKRSLLAALRASSQHSYPYEWLRRGTAELPVFWSGAEGFTESSKKQLLSPRLRSALGSLSSWDAIAPIRRDFEAKAWDRSPLHWMTYVDLRLRLPELLLMRLDKMGMAVSLEGRVPFLDHKFVELALSIPAEVKTSNGELKHILKKAVRGVIPDEFIDRKKQGFGAPVADWLDRELGELACRELRQFCREADFLDPRATNTLLRRELKDLCGTADLRDWRLRGRFRFSKAPIAWYLLNFVLWWKEYIAERPSSNQALYSAQVPA